VNAESPTQPTRKHGDAALLHATAVIDESGAVTVFAVNRSRTEPLPLTVELRGLNLSRVVEHSALTDADPDAKNTLHDPERVALHLIDDTILADSNLNATLPPLSWNVIRLA
jgi:alpha-N-arabinofuranosidase